MARILDFFLDLGVLILKMKMIGGSTSQFLWGVSGLLLCPFCLKTLLDHLFKAKDNYLESSLFPKWILLFVVVSAKIFFFISFCFFEKPHCMNPLWVELGD
jgi:hypothetical protein